MTRRQVVAFLPSAVSEPVQRVRARWDPETAQRIAPHITLVHDTADAGRLQSGLELAAAGTPLRVHLGAARCWAAPAAGIYLAVDDVSGDIDRVRRALHVVSPSTLPYVPHVTLVHPRTVEPPRAREAWEQLVGWDLDSNVMITDIAVIELDDSSWRVTSSSGTPGLRRSSPRRARS